MKWNPEEGKQRLGGTKPLTDTPRPATTPSPYTAYSARAKEFVENTRDLDMSELHREFLPHIPPGGLILDVGAGSGRDSKIFLDRGYDVVALEPDSELARLAAEYIDYYVIQETIQNYKPSPTIESDGGFHGVWASASLLHISPTELDRVFLQLAHLLQPGGVLYCSFKYSDKGIDVRERGGLQYTYLNEQTLDSCIPKGLFEYIKAWVTEDRRTDRKGERWLNVLLRRTVRGGVYDAEVLKLAIGHLEAQHRAAQRNEMLLVENEQLKERLITLRGQMIAACEKEWQVSRAQSATFKAAAHEASAIERCIRAMESIQI